MKLTTPTRNKEETQLFLSQSPYPYEIPGFIEPQGYRLMRSRDKLDADGTKFTIALIYNGRDNTHYPRLDENYLDSETVYKVTVLSRPSPNAYLAIENCSQVLVWRQIAGPHSAATRGLPTLVFNHLLDNHNIVISDDQQTEDGKRFWLDRMGESFTTSNKSIYYVDLNVVFEDSMTPRIAHIATFHDLLEHYVPNGWGNTEEFKDRLFILSKETTGLATLKMEDGNIEVAAVIGSREFQHKVEGREIKEFDKIDEKQQTLMKNILDPVNNSV
ncbi:hypothetical protein VV869_14640 [Photobacterium sp. MCCC 1A19761]|uniref:hypothetical protein n=1 Tax=Photobacterium sp. MCCC 1A19761 TaxID=3115000 RepID=UPI00307D2C31